MRNKHLLLAISIWCLSVIVGAEAAPQGAAASGQGQLPPGAGASVLRSRCTSCHGVEFVLQQRLTQAAWSRELDKMTGWGARLTEEERNVLLSYLPVHFGSVTSPPPASAAAERVGRTLVGTRCATCHDARLIAQQRLDTAGWRREVEKMNSWGAGISPGEQGDLVEFLASGLAR